MYRVPFDSNTRTVAGNYILDPRSLEAIAPHHLREGLRIVLYMSDVEMEAVLEFDPDPQWGGWTAKGDDKTIKYPRASEE